MHTQSDSAYAQGWLYTVIIIMLLCLAWQRISFGKCLASAVMTVQWIWVEIYFFLTALQVALGEEQDDPLSSETHIGAHSLTHKLRRQLNAQASFITTLNKMQIPSLILNVFKKLQDQFYVPLSTSTIFWHKCFSKKNVLWHCLITSVLIRPLVTADCSKVLYCCALWWCFYFFSRLATWHSTISAMQTHHTSTGQRVALFPYCLPSL